MIVPYQIRWVREIINFVLIVGGIFLVGMFFMFSQALQIERDHYTTVPQLQAEKVLSYVSNTQSFSSFSMKDTYSQVQDIAWEDIEKVHITGLGKENLYDYNLSTHLEENISSYTFAFNRVVPGNRLIVPSLDIDTPVVNVKYASDKKLQDADFQEELTSGVVRYPFTAIPGSIGNSLIFGHSSIDRLEKDNPYGFVFYKLSKIDLGEDIHVIREGKLHTYTVEDKVVKNPKDVSDELVAYNDDAYLTLMACYPLFSDSRRMLVRAKYKKDDGTLFAKGIDDQQQQVF